MRGAMRPEFSGSPSALAAGRPLAADGEGTLYGGSGRESLDEWGTVYYVKDARLRERSLEFVYTPMFERTRKALLSDEDMRRVEDELLAEPERGALLRDSGGVRKIRAAPEGRGKSGGARVAYVYLPDRETVYFLIAFAKNVQANLSAGELKLLRQVVTLIKGERWPATRRALA